MKKIIKMIIAIVLVVSMSLMTYGAAIEDENNIKNDFNGMIDEFKAGHYLYAKNKIIGVDIDKIDAGELSYVFDGMDKLFELGESLVPEIDKVKDFVKDKEVDEIKDLTKYIFADLNFEIVSIVEGSGNNYVLNLRLVHPTAKYYNDVLKSIDISELAIQAAGGGLAKFIPLLELVGVKKNLCATLIKTFIKAYNKIDVTEYEKEEIEFSIKVIKNTNGDYCYDCSELFKKDGEKLALFNKELSFVFAFIYALCIFNKYYFYAAVS